MPQFEILKISFSCNVPKALREQTEARQIFSIHYWQMEANLFMPRNWAENGGGRPQWDLKVGVCRREDAALVRHYLRETALPAARKWLFESAGVKGEPSFWKFNVEFEEIEKQFSMRASRREK